MVWCLWFTGNHCLVVLRNITPAEQIEQQRLINLEDMILKEAYYNEPLFICLNIFL
jgi:hypothetical protein